MPTRAAALGCFLSLLLPAAASAQGFGIYEQGSCTMARAGAAVAEPCADASAIYVNPAGLAGQKGVILTSGATLVFGAGHFTSDVGRVGDLTSDVGYPPHLYLVYGLNEKLAFGAGLYAPYGLNIKWPLDFEGRFVSYHTDLKTLYIQPSVGYAVNERLSVGGGLIIAASMLRLNRREDLARVPIPSAPGLTFGALVDQGTDFANTDLTSEWSTGIGAHVGVVIKANDRLRIGAKYLSQVSFDYEGTANFSAAGGPFVVTKANPLGLPVGTPLDAAVSQVVGALQDQPATTDLKMPAQFQVGVSVHATDAVRVSADYQWIDWSVFDAVPLDFANAVPPDEVLVENFVDTSGLRVGVDYQWHPNLRVSGGYFYNQAAAPDETVTPILPEAKRNHMTLGFGWNASDKLTLDAAYQYVHAADRRGRVVNPPAGQLPTVALNTGVYHIRAYLLGLSLTYRF